MSKSFSPNSVRTSCLYGKVPLDFITLWIADEDWIKKETERMTLAGAKVKAIRHLKYRHVWAIKGQG